MVSTDVNLPWIGAIELICLPLGVRGKSALLCLEK